MEHLADELDARGFVGVLFFEVHDEAEGAVFEGRVRGADDYCVPVRPPMYQYYYLAGGGSGEKSVVCRGWY